MQDGDKRLSCSDEKKGRIKATKLATQLRRQHQVCRIFECKVVEKRLNRRQREELQMLFVEGKWFYNHVLAMKRNGVKLRDVNTTGIKDVRHFDKDGNEVVSRLRYLSSQQKQAIVARMISNEKAIVSLIRNRFQNRGQLQFKSELSCIPLKQYGNTYCFRSANKVRVSGVSGTMLVRTGNQL